MTRIRLPVSHEEKVAKKLSQLVNDYDLDLEAVGVYFARVSGTVAYNRVKEIIEVAQLKREQDERTNDTNYLF